MDTDLPVSIAVSEDADVVVARQNGRAVARRIGMSASLQTLVATAISEVARNIVTYAGSGELAIRIVDGAGRAGIEVVASDDGPGIADTDQAMQDGFSSSGSLGLGLPGARRLMDEFTLSSTPGEGTTITMRKWTSEGR